jgi:hypothetical protein
MDHGMGGRIAWAGALLLQQRHFLSSSTFYSSLQNILAHKAFILKYFTKKKQTFKKRKNLKDTGPN